MRKAVFMEVSEGSSGLTLLEALMAISIFALAMLVAVTIFRGALQKASVEHAEKKVYSEALRVFGYMEKVIPSAMCNDMEGPLRINFIGSTEEVRFVSPFSEGRASDLAKFGIYVQEGNVKVSLIRVDAEKPDFEFPAGFPGAQVAGEGIAVFELSYCDGTQWQSSWNTRGMENPALPRYVRVRLVVDGGKTEGKTIYGEFQKDIPVGW